MMDGIVTNRRYKQLLLPNPFEVEYKNEIVEGKKHVVGYMSCKECGRYFGKSLSIDEMKDCHNNCMVIKSLTISA